MKHFLSFVIVSLFIINVCYGQDDQEKEILLSKSRTTMTSSDYRTNELMFRTVAVADKSTELIATEASEQIARKALHKLLCAYIDMTIKECIARQVITTKEIPKVSNACYKIAAQMVQNKGGKAIVIGRHRVLFKKSDWRCYTGIELSKSDFAKMLSKELSVLLKLGTEDDKKLIDIFTHEAINFQWEQEIPSFENEDVEQKIIATGDKANLPVHVWAEEPVTQSKSVIIAWIKEHAFAYGEGYSKDSKSEASAKARKAFYKMFRKKAKEIDLPVTTVVETRLQTKQKGGKIEQTFDEDAISMSFANDAMDFKERYFSLKSPIDGSLTHITVIVYSILKETPKSIE
jgi:hypothetical protein